MEWAGGTGRLVCPVVMDRREGGEVTAGCSVKWAGAEAPMGLSAEMDTEAGGEGCLGSSAGKEEGRERPGCSEAKAERAARMVCLEARAAQAARVVPTGSRAVRAALMGGRADLEVLEEKQDSWEGLGEGSGEIG